MSWLFSQALVEEFSADTSLAGEQFAQLNVMPTPHKFWRNDKTMEFSDLSRFGLTLRLLTETHGEELLTSYLADSRVRTLALQGKAQELRVNEAECGPRWRGSFAKYSLNSSSWKTAQLSLLEGLEEFSETWPRWGSMRNGESYLRQTLVLNILENESGYWPTPTCDSATDRSSRYAQGGIPLAMAVKMWPTPQASDNRDRGNKSTPAIARRMEKGKQVMLSMCVSSENGRLNPDWVEWLMGWPIGLTDLKPLAMDKFLEWQRQHSLCLKKGQDMSISPHPTMPQPETNCPRIDASKLSGHDQVLRDEFDEGVK